MGEPEDLAGQRAVVLRFRGPGPDKVEVEGEVHMIAANGFAYWFFSWSPAEFLDRTRSVWPDLRSGFALASKRDGWRPVRRPTFKPEELAKTMLEFEVPRYDAKLGQGWKTEKVPDDDLPDGEKATLLVRLHGLATELDADLPPEAKRRHISKDAFCDVLLLKKKTADLKEAARECREFYKDWQGGLPELNEVVDLKGNPINGETNLENLNKVWLVKYEMERGQQVSYVVMVVQRREEDVVLITFKCAIGRRHYWDSEIMGILRTLRPVREAP
jgi:hypothetical protein